MPREDFRRVAWLFVGMLAIAFTGCRAPRPSFNFWAPFGPSRVAPPKTGSYSTPQNYYPKDASPAPGAAVTPNKALGAPVQPNSSFPVDPSSNANGLGSINGVKDVPVGKWRPPRHAPEIRSVSLENNSSADRVSSPTVPIVVIPSSSVSGAGEPRRLTESQRSVAIPMTNSVPAGHQEFAAETRQKGGVVPAGFEKTSATVPVGSTGGWSQRKIIHR